MMVVSRLSVAAFALTVLLSCAVTRSARLTPPDLPAAFSSSGNVTLPEKWWTGFEDERLDQLIESSLSRNPNLLAAWDRLEQVRALARIEGADLWPTLDLNASAGRSFRGGDTVQRAGNDLSIGAAAAYELDLWGRLRAGRDAAVLEASAAEEDLQAAALSLSATVAITWYRSVETRALLALLDEQLATNQKILDLVTLRFRRGQVGAPDVFRQRQLVEANRGDIQRSLATARTLAHQLAVLTGNPPATPVAMPDSGLIELPALPDTGIPATLVQRRPDIRRSLLRVEAADARLAEAIASRFPRLSIFAAGETSGEKASALFRNWFSSLAANLIAPVLDGGRRKAEVARARADLSELLRLYEAAILTSMQEVEDALARERQQRAYITSLEHQLELAQRVASLVEERYTKGAADYLRILDALQSRQAL